MTSAISRFSWAVRRKSAMSALQVGHALGTFRTRMPRPSPPAAAVDGTGSGNCSSFSVQEFFSCGTTLDRDEWQHRLKAHAKGASVTQFDDLVTTQALAANIIMLGGHLC